MFQSRYIVPLYGLGGFQFAITSVSLHRLIETILPSSARKLT
jgi:hypothetical protein